MISHDRVTVWFSVFAMEGKPASSIRLTSSWDDLTANQQYIHIIVVAMLDASEAKTNRFINFSTYLPENIIHCSLSFR